MRAAEGDVFVAVLLGALLLPWTLLRLRAWRVAMSGEPVSRGGGVYAQAVARKARALRSERLRASLSAGTCVYAAMLCALATTCARLLGDTSLVLPAEPHEILDVRDGASRDEVRAAYRRLSLMYHPDKAGDDALAAAKFLDITRAHAVLTDATARRNWERYGNPDGYRGVQVDIGLPSWMLGGGGGGGGAAGGGGSALPALCALALVVGVPLWLMRFLAPSPREATVLAVSSAVLANGAHVRALLGGCLDGAQLLAALATGACALPDVGAQLRSQPIVHAAAALLSELSPEPLPRASAASLREQLEPCPELSLERARAPAAAADARQSAAEAAALVLLHAHVARTPLSAPLDACAAALVAQLPTLADALCALALSSADVQRTSTRATATAAAGGAAQGGRGSTAVARAPPPSRTLVAILSGVQRLHQAVPLPPCEEGEASLLQLPHVTRGVAQQLLGAARLGAAAQQSDGEPRAPAAERARADDGNGAPAAPRAAGARARRAGKKGGGKAAKADGGACDTPAAPATPVAAKANVPANAAAITAASAQALRVAPAATVAAALLGCGLAEAEVADALRVLGGLPSCQLLVDAEVEDEERVEVGDVLTVRATLHATRAARAVARLPDGAPVAHAPFVRAALPERYTLLLSAGGALRDVRLVHLQPASGAELDALRARGVRLSTAGGCDVAATEWRLKAPSTAGAWPIEVRAICSCYVGADASYHAPIVVHGRSGRSGS